MKSNKGITLVTLIITIVILMILAVVTIREIQEKGIINYAKDAKSKFEEAQQINDEVAEEIEFNMYKETIGDALIDDEQYPKLKSFITVWKTNVENEAITLPLVINYAYDFTVNYGDSTDIVTIKSADDENKTHIYTEPKEYIVTINGKCEGFNFTTFTDEAQKQKIVGIKQWGSTGFKSLSFSGCTNLIGNIPEPVESTLVNVESLSELFKNCGITSISEKLFYNISPKATVFTKVFLGCKGLQTIPENLFKKAVNVTGFGGSWYDGCFEDCINIKTIPKNLFKYNTKVTTFRNTFYGCTGLENIPEGLFDSCTEVKSFSWMFFNCKSLQSIPNNLFKYNTKVTTFQRIFAGCSSIKGAIPTGLFDNCPEVVDFYMVFYSCSNLDYLPDGLFDNCQKVNSFYYSFGNCSKLQGTAPQLWNRENITTGSDCFYNCTKLTNYADIPIEWR